LDLCYKGITYNNFLALLDIGYVGDRVNVVILFKFEIKNSDKDGGGTVWNFSNIDKNFNINGVKYCESILIAI